MWMAGFEPTTKQYYLASLLQFGGFVPLRPHPHSAIHCIKNLPKSKHLFGITKYLFTFVENIFMKLKKDTTEALSFRIDKGLKRKLKKKYGRKLSAQVVPLLEKLCG